jgi:hypothetical protein
MKASSIVSAATAAMLLCGASASRAGDPPAPPPASNTTASNATQTAAPSSSGLSVSASRAKADEDKRCIKSTGTRLPPSDPPCHPQQPGHVLTGKDLQRTGGTDTASALQAVGDPTLTITHH